MIDAIRPEAIHSKQMMQGWSVSLLLHLGLVFVAATMLPKMTIVLEQEPFRWDVALVEPSQEDVRQESPAPASPVPPTPQPRVQPVRPVEPIHETEMPRVASRQSVEMSHPVIEPQKREPVQEPVHEMVQAQVKPIEPQEVQKAEVKEPEPVLKEVAKQEAKEPVREVAPVAEPVAPAYTYQAPTPEQERSAAVASVPPAPVAEPAPPAPAAAPAVPAQPAQKAIEESPLPVAAPSANATASEPPTQIAKLAPQASPPAHSQAAEPKADHRWVGESLWRRVAELKRYPTSARLNGLEGRVVLKAVIRSDGQLAEVTVVKSSGHAVLDAAAMEAVKLACPLHMKHPIGPPQIVVSLPIVYSLAN
ncbi:energy transducer TonB [Nitrospira moscoviensis]|uniref:TonB C-terminal domain-containing protein n=1 Tax=Nitrospira moscoviensis TaxID=42253 RepID=A0A0K2G7P4_NITMO|nr:energy transducer TonB [Nitrospira moscoviensis]ALA56986.1 protein of unknown function (TonB domain) [Nitrospira moscoviensis]